MRETTVTLPVLSLIAGTRAMLGAGAALLLGERLTPKEKKAVGWTLLLVGALTTIPLAAQALSRSRRVADGRGQSPYVDEFSDG
jgi:hypothetical protein